MFELKAVQHFATEDQSGKRAVQILVAVEGCGIVEAAGTNPVTLAKGDAVVVPAAVGEFQVRPQWSVELIKATVPGQPLPEPETRM
jgi:mannose-6-phosphate isomerase class I